MNIASVHPCIVPDTSRVRRDQALDIATEFLRALRRCSRPQALYVLPNGEVIIRAELAHADRFSLVGFYRFEHTTILDVVDDILALDREQQCPS